MNSAGEYWFTLLPSSFFDCLCSSCEANDPEFIEEVRRRLGARIPALADASYARGHAGIYDVTPD
jgi:glycine/D-amino acid oxidase-like deaminating enzyme